MIKIKSNWDEPTNLQRLELVFEGRNKEFGAFDIRRKYERNMAAAFILTCGVLLLITGLTQVALYHTAPEKNTLPDRDVVYELSPDIETPLPEKPVTPPPPLKQEGGNTQQFTHPIVVNTPVADSVPSQETLLTHTIGTVTNTHDTTDAPPELPPVENTGSPSSVFTHVEEMPSFPGGDAALLNYLAGKMHYPADARELGIAGTVYISFIVNTSGAIVDVEQKNRLGGGCEEEALRVIKSMPTWSPGKQNGRAVNVQMVVPVKFVLH